MAKCFCYKNKNLGLISRTSTNKPPSDHAIVMLPGPGQGRALGLLSRALELFGEFQASETPYLNKQARWCLRDHPTQDCPLAFIYTTHIGMCACARMHTRTHTHIHVPRKESCSVEDSLGKAVYKLAASVLPSEPTHSEGKNPLHRTVL